MLILGLIKKIVENILVMSNFLNKLTPKKKPIGWALFMQMAIYQIIILE